MDDMQSPVSLEVKRIVQAHGKIQRLRDTYVQADYGLLSGTTFLPVSTAGENDIYSSWFKFHICVQGLRRR